eukprot:scaffold170678_cov16-Prasinocladus_malaysianus.AAC.1
MAILPIMKCSVRRRQVVHNKRGHYRSNSMVLRTVRDSILNLINEQLRRKPIVRHFVRCYAAHYSTFTSTMHGKRLKKAGGHGGD